MVMKRRASSIASSRDFAWTNANPSMSSFVSAKGPSVAANLPPASLTWVPFVGLWSPPVMRSTPDAAMSSVSLAIAAIRSGVGGVLLVWAYVIRNFMVSSLVAKSGVLALGEPRFEWTSSEGVQDRHGRPHFLGAPENMLEPGSQLANRAHGQPFGGTHDPSSLQPGPRQGNKNRALPSG